MLARRIAAWAALGIVGIAGSAVLTVGTTSLVRQPVGLGSEPVTAGELLVPSPSPEGRRAASTRQGRRDGQPARRRAARAEATATPAATERGGAPGPAATTGPLLDGRRAEPRRQSPARSPNASPVRPAGRDRDGAEESGEEERPEHKRTREHAKQQTEREREGAKTREEEPERARSEEPEDRPDEDDPAEHRDD